MEQKHTFDFAQLDGNNYEDWSWSMKLLLKYKKLFKFVDGSAAKPELGVTGVTQAHVDNWAEKDEEALCAICMSIRLSQRVHVKRASTSKEAWDLLEKQFKRSSVLDLFCCAKRLFTLRYDAGSDINKHITHFHEAYERIREMGLAIDDKLLAVILLQSMPYEEHESLIDSIDVNINSNDANFTFEKVKSMLIHRITRKSDGGLRSGLETVQSEKAHVANGKQKFKKKPVQEVKCFECGEKGHYKRDCPKRQSTSSGYHNGQTQKSGNSKAFAKAAECEEDFSVHFALTASVNLDDSSHWIVDSGASSHMVNDRSFILDY